MSGPFRYTRLDHVLNTCGAWLLGLLWFLPLAYAFWTAFHPSAYAVRFDLLAPLTLENFATVLFDGRTSMSAWWTEVILADDGVWLFGRQLFNSLVVAVFTSAVGIGLSCTAAYSMSRFAFPGRDVGMQLFLVTQMFPGVVMLIPLYILLDELGLLDSLTGLALVYSTTAIPFCTWNLKGYFDTIPKELEDAMSRQAQAERERQSRIILSKAEEEIAESFERASEHYRRNQAALHLRAMNMVFEGLKQKGSMIIVPSTAVETMGLGAMGGLTAFDRIVESGKEPAVGADAPVTSDAKEP